MRAKNILNKSLCMCVCFRHIAFFSGSILAVFIILTVIDEDFLAVQHIISTMTVLGIIVTICRSCIPDEVRIRSNMLAYSRAPKQLECPAIVHK